jgi:hypothetical protein
MHNCKSHPRCIFNDLRALMVRSMSRAILIA